MKSITATIMILIVCVLTVSADTPVEIPPNWQCIGPYGGQISDIQFGPAGSDVVYCNTVWKHAPLYRSDDKGRTWSIVNKPSDPFSNLVDIAVSRIDPDVFILSGILTAYSTTDGGNTWFQMEEKFFKGFTFSYSGSLTVYAWDYVDLFKSSDAGMTWQTLADLDVYDIDTDPQDANHLLGVTEDGFYESFDGGLSWDLKSSEQHIQKLKFGKTVDDLYMMKWDSEAIYHSSDGGITWTSYEFNGELYDFDVVDEPVETIYVAIRESDDPGSVGGLYRSLDKGASFELITPEMKLSGFQVAGNPSDAQNVFFQGDSTFRYTFDGGTEWQVPGEMFPGSEILSIGVSPLQPGMMLAGIGRRAKYMMKTVNGGKDWFFTNYWDVDNRSSMLRFAFSKTDPDKIYAAGHLILKSVDQGMNWQTIGPGHLGASAITVSDADDNVVFAGNSGGEIMRSTDGGATWNVMYAAEFQNGTVYVHEIAFTPSNPDRMYALVEKSPEDIIKLLKSTDAGVTWQEASRLPTIAASDLAISYTDPEVIYVCDTYSPLRSIDHGVSWELIDLGHLSGADYCMTTSIHPSWVWEFGWNQFFISSDLGVRWKALTMPDLYGEVFGERSCASICGNKRILALGTQYDGIWTYPESLEPQIMLAGSYIIQGKGKSIIFSAYVPQTETPTDVESVEILYDGNETGLQLWDDGSHGDAVPDDGLYSLELTLNTNASINNLHFSIIAKNKFGMISQLWPYLIIK